MSPQNKGLSIGMVEGSHYLLLPILFASWVEWSEMRKMFADRAFG